MNWFGLTGLLAQAPTVDERERTRGLLNVGFMVVLMCAMFYLAFLRPQQKKAKEHEALVKALKPRDKVVTSGGLVGEVISLKERTVAVRSGDSKFEVLKSAITEVLERADGSSPSSSAKS